MVAGWYRLTGHSMWPLVEPVEARLEPCEVSSLRPGDMIAWLNDPRHKPFVWHRVHAVRRSGDALYVVTRGDTLFRSDAPVPASAVLGKVVALRAGPLTVPIDGALGGTIARRVGLAWSSMAPTLLRLYVALRSRQRFS